jgi:hypothetical protein
MSSNLENESKRDCNVGQQKPWIRVIVSLGMSYIFVRSAESVVFLTYATMGKIGALFVLFCSVVYFGIITIMKLGKKQGDAKARTLYWLKEAPNTLALGIIASIVMVCFEHSEVEPIAYSLRVLVIVCAFFSLYSFSGELYKLFRGRSAGQIVDRKMSGEMESNVMGTTDGTVEWWSSMNSRTRVLLVVCYLMDSVLWSWLVIYYRYLSHSFLGQSTWIMASLLIFLSSCWLHCAGVLFIAYRWVKAVGLDGGPRSRA